MKQDIQDRIDDYILDRMSTEDRLRFEDEVSQNALEKDRLDFTRNLRVAVNLRTTVKLSLLSGPVVTVV